MTAIKERLPESAEAWRAQRKKGLGGSDAGAVLGLNPYKSPYALWAEKTGSIPDDKPDSEAMRLGRDLEEYVAKRFCEQTGKKVRKSGFCFVSKDHPFMRANVDRFIAGEKAGLECKTANQLNRTKWDRGDVPASYYAQCMHYLAVTGLDRWYLAVLQFGKGFHVYTIERDEDEIKALIEAEGEFWQGVLAKVPPAMDGSSSTTDTLAAMYPSSQDAQADMEPYHAELQEYVELEETIKALEEKKRAIANAVKAYMQDAEAGRAGDIKVSWKTVTSNRFDQKRFTKENPDLAADYMKLSSSRRFEIRKKEEE